MQNFGRKYALDGLSPGRIDVTLTEGVEVY